MGEPKRERVTSMLEARAIVAGALGKPIEMVGESAAIGRIAGWDSIGHVSIMLSLEARLGRLLRPDEVGQIKTIGDIAVILASQAIEKPRAHL